MESFASPLSTAHPRVRMLTQRQQRRAQRFGQPKLLRDLQPLHTLLDLFHHVSGYPDFYPLDFVDRRMQKDIDPEALIAQYASGKLDFEPGTRWSYSNTGYILLGRVVEKVSGVSLGDFLQRRILKPVGMEHSMFEPAADDKRLPRGFACKRCRQRSLPCRPVWQDRRCRRCGRLGCARRGSRPRGWAWPRP